MGTAAVQGTVNAKLFEYAYQCVCGAYYENHIHHYVIVNDAVALYKRLPHY